MYVKIFIAEGAFSLQMVDSSGWSMSASAAANHALLLTAENRRDGGPRSAVLVDAAHVSLRREFSGESQLYYSVHQGVLHIADSAYDIAVNVFASLSVLSCYEFVYFEYVGPGRTFFENVHQVRNGESVDFSISDKGALCISSVDSFCLPTQEFVAADELVLAKQLREKICEAHRSRAQNSNVVMLSGGIDSQVMAISLCRDLAHQNTGAATFYINGAAQNEVKDAEAVARQLKLDWVAVGVDPLADVNWKSIVRANSPYIGHIAMNQLLQSPKMGFKGATFFAGQDTRLHTPALNAKDIFLWRYIYGNASVAAGVSKAAHVGAMTLRKADEANFAKRLFGLFQNSPTFAEFLANRYFHVRRFGFSNESADFEAAYEGIVQDLLNQKPSMPRKTYNTIVGCNWRRQYTFDIAYMTETLRSNGYGAALPFYDEALSKFSASLPFDLATKMSAGRAGHGADPVKVNKYLLRKAYEKDLDSSLIFRDKAVCATHGMFLNGVLQPRLRAFFQDTECHRSSAGRRLHFPQLALMLAERQGRWGESDNWIANVAFNALVVWELMKEFKTASTVDALSSDRLAHGTPA